MKKMLFLILAVFIAATNSCGGMSGPEANNSGSANASDDSQGISNMPGEEQAQSADYEYGGEKLDFLGETFIVLYPSWGLYTDYYFAEEENGDAVNDALYRRITDTNEFFNIKIQARTPGGYDSIAPEMSKEALSGTNSFDIALTHCVSGLDSIVAQNLAYNWNDMPNVDFSKKYWNTSMNEYLNINGYMPFVANDFIIPDPCFMTFSKDLLQQYSLEDPYDIVKAGKWTWDKLTEMAKQVSKDVDGDGDYTERDLYGFVGELDWQFVNAMYACDQRVMKKNSDNRYVLDVNTEKMQTIVDKFYDLVYVGNYSFTYAYDAKNSGQPYIPFDSGRALFYMNTPTYVQELRATEFDFGILPYPKFDERQPSYVTLNWAGTICVPLNVANPEKVGAVAEYLGAKSHEIVLPAYFNILLSGKLTRDDESLDMLDIIYGDSIYDFGLNFSAFNDLLYVLPRLLQLQTPSAMAVSSEGQASNGLASFYEQRADNIQRQYDKVYDAFIANSEAQ